MSESALMLQAMNEEYELLLVRKSNVAQSIEKRNEELHSLLKSFDKLNDDTELAKAKVHDLKTKSARKILLMSQLWNYTVFKINAICRTRRWLN